MNKLKNYKYSEFSFSVIIEGLKTRLFNLLTKKSLKIFLKGGDVLSIYPQTRGNYEQSLINIIQKISKDYKYNHFFFDVGANIGLISCQCGNSFKEVHLFEPNPDCFKVLNVNLDINNKKFKSFSHNFALGEVNKKLDLYIPLHNWGGAFILDKNNTYNKKILSNKDGYKSFNEKNYLKKKITVKKSKEVLGRVFNNLSKKNYHRGIIKIDVEGYEATILKGIAEAIPKKTQLFIIFENFKPDLDLNKIIDIFNRKIKIYKIVRDNPWKENWPDFLKGISMIIKGKINTKILDPDGKNWKGHIIMHVK